MFPFFVSKLFYWMKVYVVFCTFNEIPLSTVCYLFWTSTGTYFFTVFIQSYGNIKQSTDIISNCMNSVSLNLYVLIAPEVKILIHCICFLIYVTHKLLLEETDAFSGCIYQQLIWKFSFFIFVLCFGGDGLALHYYKNVG